MIYSGLLDTVGNEIEADRQPLDLKISPGPVLSDTAEFVVPRCIIGGFALYDTAEGGVRHLMVPLAKVKFRRAGTYSLRVVLNGFAASEWEETA